MRDLDKLKKNPKPALIKMARRLGIKVSAGWNRTVLARKILEKQKLDELKEPEPSIPPESEPESKIKPEFESLATEAPEIEPESPQVEEPGRGGYREGAGRTPGLTDEKARVQRLLKNQVPDPVIQFIVESIFGLAGEPKKSVEPTTEMLTIPITNLKQYYFPNLNASPVLQVWFELGIGVKNLVMSQMKKRKAEPEQPEKPEPKNEEKPA